LTCEELKTVQCTQAGVEVLLLLTHINYFMSAGIMALMVMAHVELQA
jgi:hypothetical protein